VLLCAGLQSAHGLRRDLLSCELSRLCCRLRLAESEAMSVSLLDPDAPTVASCVFVPQLPELCPSFAPHTLLHLRVGLLNVAYSSGGGGAGLAAAPMHQPLALPLSLHLHPDLLTAEQRGEDVDSDSLDAFEPPSLVALQRAILPSVLGHLPAMIAAVKVKKMDTKRGNTVGLLRTKQLVFTFTFRETTPPYHVLTTSAKRVKMLDREAREREQSRRATAGTAAQASAGASAAAIVAPVPGASLSSTLSSFALPSSPTEPVSLQPLSSLRGAAGAPDEGFYSGGGFASFLVSRHALHVRMVPSRLARERMLAERETERERREEQQLRDTSFQRGEERWELQEEDAAERRRVGEKRKQPAAVGSSSAAATTASAAASKRSRGPSPSRLDDDALSAAATAVAPSAGDAAASSSAELSPLSEAEEEDDGADEGLDDWLQLEG